MPLGLATNPINTILTDLSGQMNFLSKVEVHTWMILSYAPGNSPGFKAWFIYARSVFGALSIYNFAIYSQSSKQRCRKHISRSLLQISWASSLVNLSWVGSRTFPRAFHLPLFKFGPTYFVRALDTVQKKRHCQWKMLTISPSAMQNLLVLREAGWCFSKTALIFQTDSSSFH